MKFRSSFGFQLTCLVLTIVLPATLVTAYDFATSLSNKRESSYASLQSIADQCAHDLDGLLWSTAAVLKDVSDLVEIFNGRRATLQPVLAWILENHPEYANIRLLDREGLLLASAMAAQHPVSYDDRVQVSQAIAGFSAILLEEHGGRLGEVGTGLLRRVDDGARKMGELIDGLLQFSRVSRVELKRQMTDMDALLREVLVDYKTQIETRRIQLAVRPLGHAACDRGAFVHLFSNLISNAVKYTRAQPLPRSEIGCEESGGETVYYVRDNGIGFDMKYVDKLTQVFQKLHPNYEGSGIGLAIVKRFVEKHGGGALVCLGSWAGGYVLFQSPKNNDD